MKLLGGHDEKPAKPAARGGSSSVDTLIGSQTEIRGDVVFAGGLHVDGHIKGRVMAEAEVDAFLSISESGHIEGDISVPKVTVNGQIKGNLHAAGKVTLAPKARITGNVYYKVLEMQPGAQVNGQLLHESATEAPPALADQSQPGGANVVEVGEARRNQLIT
ncbi:MAG: bactofilin family protein [Panacagrimonas sp.]